MKNSEAIQSIEFALSQQQSQFIISPFRFELSFENQLLFFFKPECFFQTDSARTRNLLDMAFKKFARFDLEISGGLLLDGQCLEQLSIIDHHYGFINKLSKEGMSVLSDEDKEKIEEILRLDDLSAYPVLGGHEFLSHHPEFDELSLRKIWRSKKSIKIRSGLYLQKYPVKGKEIILLNGFHPFQLSHYTNPRHKIVLLLLHSNTHWHQLRSQLTGDTYPERAIHDSIRGEIFKNAQDYGLSTISISSNCVHLSAGPFEALFEINNFLKNIPGIRFDLSQTNMNHLMTKKGFEQEEMRQCLLNPAAEIDGTPTDLFTYTEDKDSTEAISDYLAHF